MVKKPAKKKPIESFQHRRVVEEPIPLKKTVKAEPAEEAVKKCDCGEPALPNNHQCYKCSHRS